MRPGDVPGWAAVAMSIVTMVATPVVSTYRAGLQLAAQVEKVERRVEPLESIRDRLAGIEQRMAVQESELRHIRELLELTKR